MSCYCPAKMGLLLKPLNERYRNRTEGYRETTRIGIVERHCVVSHTTAKRVNLTTSSGIAIQLEAADAPRPSAIAHRY